MCFCYSWSHVAPVPAVHVMLSLGCSVFALVLVSCTDFVPQLLGSGDELPPPSMLVLQLGACLWPHQPLLPRLGGSYSPHGQCITLQWPGELARFCRMSFLRAKPWQNFCVHAVHIYCHGGHLPRFYVLGTCLLFHMLLPCGKSPTTWLVGCTCVSTLLLFYLTCFASCAHCAHVLFWHVACRVTLLPPDVLQGEEGYYYLM